MEKLTVSFKNIHRDYSLLREKWNKTDNIFLRIKMPEEDRLGEFVSFLIEKTPDEFALDVLAELVESENLDFSLLKKIYSKGNTACKVAICLRDDLDNELNYLCKRDKERIVREHYFNRKKNSSTSNNGST